MSTLFNPAKTKSLDVTLPIEERVKQFESSYSLSAERHGVKPNDHKFFRSYVFTLISMAQFNDETSKVLLNERIGKLEAALAEYMTTPKQRIIT